MNNICLSNKSNTKVPRVLDDFKLRKLDHGKRSIYKLRCTHILSMSL